jgi:hypothetical protein
LNSSTLVALFAALPLAIPLVSQEQVRDVGRPGEQNKHLTTDTVDLWRLEAKADEILRVSVSSRAFDPVLELVRLGDNDTIVESVVPEVDDDGSESWLLKRLATSGRYGIRVHGPGNRGGGNYRFWIERMTSVDLPPGAREIEGRLGEDGLAHVRVVAKKGEALAPFGAGVAELIDPMGHALPAWEGCYDAERDGEHYVRVRGQAGAPFRAGSERGRRRPIGAAAETTENLPAYGLDEWTFAGHVDEFRTLMIRGERLAVRLLTEPDKTNAGLENRPPLRWLPMHGKGRIQRHACVLGRDREYRLQIRSASPETRPYELRFGDTSVPLAPAEPVERVLAVGGAEFFTFAAKPGQVLRIDAESQAFDPLVRLTTASGLPCGENDDGGSDLASRYGWLVTSAGTVRAQVACFGDGGGGKYRLTLTDVPVPSLAIGKPETGTLGEGATEHWHFAGRAGQTLFFSARSQDVDTMLTLHDPTGVAIGSDEDGGGDRNALLALRLPRDGRYTLAVGARGGRGEYQLQAIDPDAAR